MANSEYDIKMAQGRQKSIADILGMVNKEVGADTETKKKIYEAVLMQQLGVGAENLPASPDTRNIIQESLGLPVETRGGANTALSLASALLRRKQATEVAEMNNKRVMSAMNKDELDKLEGTYKTLMANYEQNLQALMNKNMAMGGAMTQQGYEEMAIAKTNLEEAQKVMRQIADVRSMKVMEQNIAKENAGVPVETPAFIPGFTEPTAPTFPRSDLMQSLMGKGVAPSATPIMPSAPVSAPPMNMSVPMSATGLVQDFLKPKK